MMRNCVAARFSPGVGAAVVVQARSNLLSRSVSGRGLKQDNSLSSLTCSQSTIHRPPYNHGRPPGTKLLGVLTGYADATGSPKHPPASTRTGLRRNHPPSRAVGSIFIPTPERSPLAAARAKKRRRPRRNPLASNLTACDGTGLSGSVGISLATVMGPPVRQ